MQYASQPTWRMYPTLCQFIRPQIRCINISTKSVSFMKVGWRTLAAQIKLGNILSILVLNLHTGRPLQISLLPVCCVHLSVFFFCSSRFLPPFSLVTNPLARTVRQDFKRPVPQTAAEFAWAFLASEASVANLSDINTYFNEFVGHRERALAYKQSATAEHATTQPKGSAYTISIPMQARIVLLRRVQILRGHIAPEVIHLMWVFSSNVPS